MEWRGGFGVAACSILAAFFTQDTDFLDPEARKEFSQAMLKQNRFIFRDNAGLAPKVSGIIYYYSTSILIICSKAWTGMWRAPFILQTFASHLNFTYGHVEIPNLHTKESSARAAFTLTVAAVSHVLF